MTDENGKVLFLKDKCEQPLRAVDLYEMQDEIKELDDDEDLDNEIYDEDEYYDDDEFYDEDLDYEEEEYLEPCQMSAKPIDFVFDFESESYDLSEL